jgi:hypothetical protein
MPFLGGFGYSLRRDLRKLPASSDTERLSHLAVSNVGDLRRVHRFMTMCGRWINGESSGTSVILPSSPITRFGFRPALAPSVTIVQPPMHVVRGLLAS